VLPVDVSDARLSSARADWAAGERRLAAARRDPARAATVDRLVDELRRELVRRIGRTYTLAELVTAYEAAGPWARDLAQRLAPGQPWAQDLSLIADPVFAAAARGARDWKP
jgi:hypothetical protein